MTNTRGWGGSSHLSLLLFPLAFWLRGRPVSWGYVWLPIWVGKQQISRAARNPVERWGWSDSFNRLFSIQSAVLWSFPNSYPENTSSWIWMRGSLHFFAVDTWPMFTEELPCARRENSLLHSTLISVWSVLFRHVWYDHFIVYNSESFLSTQSLLFFPLALNLLACWRTNYN